MSDRWIPVLAAAVGVVGGIGGALAGGLVAIQGQESEREDARADARRAIYATFIQEADSLVTRLGIKYGELDRATDLGRTEKEAAVDALLLDALPPVVRAQAAVDLVVEDDEVMRAAQDIKDAFSSNKDLTDAWEGLRENFIQAAREAEGLSVSRKR